MVDEVLYRVVFMATMYTNACGLHLLEGSLLPSETQIMQMIATQNTDVNVHANWKRLLDGVEQWLEWSDMKVKIPKCHATL